MAWTYFKIILFSLGFLYSIYNMFFVKKENSESKKYEVMLIILFGALLFENIQKIY